MSVTQISPEMAALAERGSIGAEDVLTLRQKVFADGVVSAAEADQLFLLNHACDINDPSWNTFFIEALTDYMVYQAEPSGYVTADNADWIIERISHDGKVNNETELELLLSVLDNARWVPPRLVNFALTQVKRSVISGQGPLRNGKKLKPGSIGEAEVDCLRRALYALAGDGNIGITQQEAEILFDINDVTRDADNDPSWQDLFVKAIANHLMAASGYQVPSREEALAREAWLGSEDSVVAFSKGMISGGLKAIFDAYTRPDAEQRALEKLKRQKLEIIIGEAITVGESSWLADRISRDGVISKNEKALLSFIKSESPNIHPSLQPLLDKVS